ncbi:hypothetical protein MLD38_000814 [Melastoma candidum]|uniref:Uncharacterized protein n=1 Tax=Melastoma candidum TaxID=119954 RepID=A0ACB9SJX2_9MYRT|nr:hypothetical protein MLD38_000814 [Melastoma candidum]
MDNLVIPPSSETPPPRPEPDPEPYTGQPLAKKAKMSSTSATSDDEASTDAAALTVPRPPRYKRRKIAIFFAYCGVGYQGMQKNPGAKTIEGDFEEALYHSGAVPEAERGMPKRWDWARSARTDKGVSAVGQVVSGKFYIDPPGLVERLNENLSQQIRVFGLKRVTASFSAKKFCDRRRYVYLVPVFALDERCHRDRESVSASRKEGDEELVKCVECSERGRKVAGLMGKRSYQLRGDSESGEGEAEDKDGLGVSSNTRCAADVVEDSVRGECSGTDVCGEFRKDDCGEIKSEQERSEIVVDDVGEGNSTASGEKVEKSNGVEINDLVVESREKVNNNSNLGVRTGTSNEMAGFVEGCGENPEENGTKGSGFCYGEKEKERFNRILRHYVGTHNFHNFTTRIKAEDPSAKRFIISFEANTVVTVGGIGFVKCEVVGQSFMLHQIRKLIGLAVAIMRNCAPELLISKALQTDVRVNVPTAPEVGLYLDECFFTSYNKKWRDSHEELSMKAYEKEAEEFKMKYIHAHIAATEQKEGVVALWLHSLNHRNYPDLLGSEEGKDAVGEKSVE